jgi:hypothetical protein
VQRADPMLTHGARTALLGERLVVLRGCSTGADAPRSIEHVVELHHVEESETSWCIAFLNMFCCHREAQSRAGRQPL